MAPRSIKRRAAGEAEPEEKKQLLVNMPIDVLIEIFPYLKPLDLLHLCRTTKGLRAFLLNRNKCSTLWKSVISNVGGYRGHGLPSCPDHISAPAYTHLAFVPVCHGCFGPCETVEWELRMRCCSNCWTDMTIPHPPVNLPPYADLERLNLPMTSRHSTLMDNNSDVRVGVDYFPAVCSRLDVEVAMSRELPKDVPISEFVVEQNKLWDSIVKHARLCQGWHREILRVKGVQLTRVRDRRIQDIKRMLSKQGWTQSDLSGFSKLPEVNKLEPLTPTEWAMIQPRLIFRLEKVKEMTIWLDRIGTCKSAITYIQGEVIKDPAVKVKPETVDIAMLSVVRSMVESSIRSDFTIDDAKKKLSRVVPQAIRKWSSDAVKELESFAREQLNLSPLSKPSSLPSVIFRCNQCADSERLTFDEALSHQHLHKKRYTKKRSTSRMSIHESLQLEYTWLPRDIHVLQVDVRVSRKVENLIKRMGKNPSRVTYGEMCASPVKVACCVCRLPTDMDFKAAFDHCLVDHLGQKETEIWTRISARKIAETSEDK